MKTRAPLESTVTTTILKALNALPDTYAVKLHGSQFGRVGTPDILCVRQRTLRLDEPRPSLSDNPFSQGATISLDLSFVIIGQAYFLEVKRPGAKPTPAQLAEMARWTGVGAVCRVVRTVQEALEAVG